MVEVLIACLIGMVVISITLLIVQARYNSLYEQAVSQDARESAESALSALSAVSGSLTVGGTFDLQSDNKIALTGNCTAAFCDYVFAPDAPDAQKTSFARGVPFGTSVPAGSSVKFLRRWKVEEENTNYKLRKITVVVAAGIEDIRPSVAYKTIVPTNR